MKLIYLADIRFPMERANGIQTAETVHALARLGHEVCLVVRRTDGRSDEECLRFFNLPPHPNVRLERLSVPPRLARLGFLWKSLGVMRRPGYDFVYTRDLGLAYAALRTRALHRRFVVYEAIALQTAFREEAASLYEGKKPPSAWRRAWQRHVEHAVLTGADGVIATTGHLLAAIEKDFGKPARAAVVPNGARVPDILPPRVSSATRPQIYYIGQLYPWKGVGVLVEAMQHVDGADLVVVGGLSGEPDLERLQMKASSLGVSTRVTFRGYVPPTEVAREWEKADVVVIPHAESRTAREFTSPLKLFEALAAGRPIVATDLPSVREILTDGENAVLVPPGDPRAMAAAIRQVIENPADAGRLGQAAFERARAFSWDARAERIEAFLTEVSRA